MYKKEFFKDWIPYVYAVPMELLFMLIADESKEDWEERRDRYIKLIFTFKKLND